MSSIYFHSRSREAVAVRGMERHWMGSIVSRMLIGLVEWDDAESWLKPLFAPDHYIQRATGQDFVRQAKTLFSIGDSRLTINGEIVEPWIVGLNTALALGNDAARLCARLHGQCEVHCWVDGADKDWIAAVIERGLQYRIFRGGMGWESVIELLRSDAGPVVCSYSVCEQFPNFGSLPDDHPLKQRDDDGRWDAFYELQEDEAFDLCMQGLREQGVGLQIKRDAWDDFYFGDGTNVFTLREKATAGIAA